MSPQTAPAYLKIAIHMAFLSEETGFLLFHSTMRSRNAVLYINKPIPITFKAY